MREPTQVEIDDVLKSLAALRGDTEYYGPYTLYAPGVTAVVDVEGRVTWYNVEGAVITRDEAAALCPALFEELP